jgi:hypothetical protein
VHTEAAGMDFAPYQSSPPERSRPFSPPQSPSPRASYDPTHNPFAGKQTNHQRSSLDGATSPPPLQHPQPQRQWSYPHGNDGDNNDDPTAARGYQAGGSGGFAEEGGRLGVSEFDTSLGVRLDYEAAAAYVLFPPVGAIILLILERSSDYVR